MFLVIKLLSPWLSSVHQQVQILKPVYQLSNFHTPLLDMENSFTQVLEDLKSPFVSHVLKINFSAAVAVSVIVLLLKVVN